MTPIEERLVKVSEGCFTREHAPGKVDKKIKQEFQKYSTYKTKARKRDKDAKPNEQMDRQFYHHDCLEVVPYAYNIEGTLFDYKMKKCNVNRLGTFLDVLSYVRGREKCTGFRPNPLKGISTSMLYFGVYGSSFPWHTEDGDLPSVNYLHEGKPKIWFCVPAC